MVQFIADGPLFLAKNWEYIDGHLGLSHQVYLRSRITASNFSAVATSTVSGGIIRSGEAFAAVSVGNFLPTGGTSGNCRGGIKYNILR